MARRAAIQVLGRGSIPSISIHLPRAITALVVVAALTMAVAPGAFGLDPATARAGALCLAALGFWATGIVPEYLTAIGFFLIAMLFAVAPPEAVFAGFHSTAWWLVFGGLVIGVAVRRTGLGDWLAAHLVGALGHGYLGMVAGVVLVGLVLGFVMPSTLGRVLIIVPIVLALADRYGFEPGSRGRNGLVLAMVLGTFMPTAAILPSNVANMVLAGAAQAIYGLQFGYANYLILHFPVTGLLKALLIVGATWLFFRDTPRAEPATDPEAVPLSGDGRKVGLILIGALILWATDEFHGVNPAWVALGAAFLCLLPRFGVVPVDAFNHGMNLGSLFYVAGILGLGAVLAVSGAGDLLGRALVQVLPFQLDAPFLNFFDLAVFSTVLAFGTTVPGVPAVMAPIAPDLVAATGLPLETVLATSVIGFSTVVLPYQLPPLVVAMGLAKIPIRAAARLTFPLAVVTLLILTPLNYLWWRALGYL
ncbi:MAG: SLC13 family permease [Alphaproteobacteria bacterium]|nr:SLC13 family permease [Alphaproteobacteria bacterium]